MILFDLVNEFFIKYVFGGSILIYDSVNGNYTTQNYGSIFTYSDEDGAFPLYLGNIDAYQFTDFNGDTFHVSLGNYLSLIASIITMVVIVVICCALIKKIYNICAHIIG